MYSLIFNLEFSRKLNLELAISIDETFGNKRPLKVIENRRETNQKPPKIIETEKFTDERWKYFRRNSPDRNRCPHSFIQRQTVISGNRTRKNRRWRALKYPSNAETSSYWSQSNCSVNSLWSSFALSAASFLIYVISSDQSGLG